MWRELYKVLPLLPSFLTADIIEIDLDHETILNTIGLDHPYVCANFDWWPDTKVDSLQLFFAFF